MKIVQFVTRSDTIGGAQKYILDTSRQLKNDGHEVTVISGGDGVFGSEVKRYGLEFIGLNSIVREFTLFYDLKGIIDFRREINLLNPDAVIIHSAKAGLIGRIALTLSASKKIFIAHGWSHIRTSSTWGQLLYGGIEKFLSLLCDRIICISKQDLKFANNNLMISKKKTSLLYSGVKEPFSRNSLSEANVYNLLTVTRFQAPKDFNTLLEALNIIHKVRSDWVLTVLGDGQDLEHYQRKTSELGLSNNIRFLGFKEKLVNFYRNSDLVILISKSEGLPLSLIEAMSHGKPILASNVGGVSELIEDGVTGYLVPPSDPYALSQTLFNALDQTRMELAALGDKSYVKYKEQFTFDEMISNLYEHLNT
ncbi:glycosyltransferase family 4 protein [Vibrio penaeicida]|uniref:glycosyltransferase family 4 protein n=1 Tax=Vibrio penaeicida TaxID=104609 RepID=UPI0027330C1A|nr:glycosyltransferase family 4 protein [Vibrio penaeicida]MDP2573133.1 glycosyltransferase family 4 protein [Vibrio penaeicida]